MKEYEWNKMKSNFKLTGGNWDSCEFGLRFVVSLVSSFLTCVNGNESKIFKNNHLNDQTINMNILLLEFLLPSKRS